MGYTKLRETQKDLKKHVASIERNGHLIKALQRKLGEQGLISNPLVEVLVDILLTQKKWISILEVDLAILQQSMVYLFNEENLGNGSLASSSAKEHGIPRGKVWVQQINMNVALTNGTNTS